MAAGGPPVHLVRGEDPSLVRDAVLALVDDLLGNQDRSLALEAFAGEDYELAAVIDAAQTPPFLTDRRVVVARDAHRFDKADDVFPLVQYLADPLATTSLVVVWESGRIPKPLVDAVKAAGGATVDASPPRGRARESWVTEHLAAAGLHVDAAARSALATQLGEDMNRLRGIAEILAATYGPGARIGAAEVAPFLGDTGTVAPWDLTDAIDRGDVPGALGHLRRLTRHGDRHPLVVLATLLTHYGRLLRLDGSDVDGEAAAAELLGLRGKSTFAAGKALRQVRRLGHDRLAQAFAWLAQADLDLKGAKDWPSELVLELLVARLAAQNLGPVGRPAARASGRASSRSG